MRTPSCSRVSCLAGALLLACCASSVQGFAQPKMAASAVATMQQRPVSSSYARRAEAPLQVRVTANDLAAINSLWVCTIFRILARTHCSCCSAIGLQHSAAAMHKKHIKVYKAVRGGCVLQSNDTASYGAFRSISKLIRFAPCVDDNDY
jgi:hypothetical protein